MVTARVLPMGDRALLLEVPALEDVLALHLALERSRPTGVVDIVPAARTVLVRIDPRVLSLGATRAWVQSVSADPEPHAPKVGDEVVLDVVYDGPDLADTAALLGVSPEALVAQHAAARWSVAFTGFAPGFGYLTSADWPYDVPRLEVPRTRVPEGSVGLAAGFTGAYPRETPGGWQLIGTTSAQLFDPDAASPALLEPGARVRFRPAPAAVTAAPSTPIESRSPVTNGRPERQVVTGERLHAGDDGAPAGAAPTGRSIRVVEPGLLTTLQDLGREGAGSVGVAVSGALDRGALRTANRLVGNPEGAAGLEVTMGGLRAVAEADLWVAVTGAWGTVRLDGREVDPYEAHAWRAGSELHLDWFAHGARGYVAVRGGLDAHAALGSRATDLLAGLGPAPLRAGDVVGVRDDAAGPVPVAPPVGWGAPHDDELELELAPGPRADWFAPAALATLYDTVWTVSNHADRVGARLDGPELARLRSGELASEGMVPGALQVPPSGRPTILLADGPVTGGYPVIAVVTDASLDLVAQARPGTRIRFRHARPGS